jgi:hypothetical protein
VSAVLQENRRAGLLYDFSVGEMHYDRNSHPRFIGDGMSNLTGSVAPIDHAAYGHIKGHQKVDNVHIKVNYDPVTNPPSWMLGFGVIENARMTPAAAEISALAEEIRGAASG